MQQNHTNKETPTEWAFFFFNLSFANFQQKTYLTTTKSPQQGRLGSFKMELGLGLEKDCGLWS
jgi:hypothetical protein